jgi:hypothetical protein
MPMPNAMVATMTMPSSRRKAALVLGACAASSPA